MFCPNCGTKNEDGVVFCAKCGTPVAEQSTSGVEPVAPSVEPVMPMGSVDPVTPVAPVEPVVTPVEPIAPTPVAPVQPQVSPVEPQVTPVQPVNNAWNGQPVNNGFQPQQPQGQPVNNFQPNNKPAAPKKGIPGIVKILIPVVAVVIALIIGIVVFVNIGKSGSDYKKTAEKYVTALTSGDYDAAFNSLTLPSSEFLTVDTFRAANADTGVGELSTLTVVDGYSVFAGPDSKTVNVSYVLNIGKVGNLELTMNKSDKKHMLFFDTYKVNASNFYQQDVIVVAPKNMTLKVNGVAVDAKYVLEAEKASEYYYNTSKADVYEIPYLFYGNAKFTIESDMLKSFEKEVVLEEKDKDEQDSITLNFMSYTSELEFKDDVAKTLQDKAVTDLQAIVKAAVDGKEFSAIADRVTAYEDWKEDVEYDYEYYNLNKMHSTSGAYDFTEQNVTDAKATSSFSSYSTYSNGQVKLKVTVTYNVAGKYTYHYSSGDKNYVQETPRSMSGYIYYTFEDGKWAIASMYLPLNTRTGTLVSTDSTTNESESASEGASEGASEAESASAAN